MNIGEYRNLFTKPRNFETKTYLEAHVGGGGAHEPEGSTDMDLHYDVKSVVGHCVKHAIVSEASYINTKHWVSSVKIRTCGKCIRWRLAPLLTMWLILPNFLVIQREE